jgi:transcriptional regulator with XRE-family HTH domain
VITTLVERLRIAREQAGLSQGQIARLLKMHRPTISEIEAGRRKVKADELAQFAEAYGVSVAWLTSTTEEEDVDDRVVLAARELSALDKDDLDKVLRFLGTLRATKGKRR